jgi:hypothetical protein
MGTESGGRGSGIDRRGVGVVLLADLYDIDGPREPRWSGSGGSPLATITRRVASKPALDVVVHVLASNDSPPG